jgi:glucosamine 6-phosphate synthetase-like amidotransferase/phosphosugar isomerase protein
MCGIFGSFSFPEYKTLYNENKKRGTFSYGNLYVKKDGSTFIHKTDGIINLTTHKKHRNEYNQFLGHTQAPTSIERSFTPINSHPFEYGQWIVAHNGVLENYKEIIGLHFPEHNNNVDSSVIPRLIHYMHGGDEVYAISEACGSLKGTYACWIYNKDSKNIYLVRSGSTLFGNKKTGSFSSAKVPGKCTKVLEEGVIYHVSDEGLTAVGGFSSHSPFFMF